MFCGRCCVTEPRSRLALRLDIFIEILPRTRRCLTCQLDRLGGTQHLARGVLCPYADVRFGSIHLDDCLEALPGDGPSQLQSVGSGSGKHLPASDLRGAVPTDIERYFAFGFYFSDDGGRLFGVPLPQKAEGPVGL